MEEWRTHNTQEIYAGCSNRRASYRVPLTVHNQKNMTKTINGIEYDEKAQALAQHLQDTSDEGLEQAQKHIEDDDYTVLTDEEADDKWDEELDNYIDECIMPEFERALPNLYVYFDTEAWKRDARYDGRGHTLSHYDGCEHDEEVDGVTYYIYRQN